MPTPEDCARHLRNDLALADAALRRALEWAAGLDDETKAAAFLTDIERESDAVAEILRRAGGAPSRRGARPGGRR